jgi:nicotinamidase-related amidase
MVYNDPQGQQTDRRTVVARVWDQYLSEQDRAHTEMHPARRKGTGERPALVLVDLYRWAFGDKPEPLLESVKNWPGSCGMAGWEALPHIQRLLAAAREAEIPVVHLTGLEDIPGWRESTPRGPGERDTSPEGLERRRQRYDIVPEVAPVRGEPVLRKAAPSAFFGTMLAPYLNGLNVDTILVAGESTSGCVRATVVDGRSYRFNMVVVEECVFDRHQAAHAINLFDMDQKYADVVPVDEAVAYLRGEPAEGRQEAAG